MICKDGPLLVIAFCLITLFGTQLCFCLYLFLQSCYDVSGIYCFSICGVFSSVLSSSFLEIVAGLSFY